MVFEVFWPAVLYPADTIGIASACNASAARGLDEGRDHDPSSDGRSQCRQSPPTYPVIRNAARPDLIPRCSVLVWLLAASSSWNKTDPLTPLSLHPLSASSHSRESHHPRCLDRHALLPAATPIWPSSPDHAFVVLPLVLILPSLADLCNFLPLIVTCHTQSSL